MTQGDEPTELQAFADRCRRQCDDDPGGFLALPLPPDPESGERMVWEHCRGFAAILLGRAEEARPSFERALGLARARGDRLWQGRTLAGLGMALGDMGDHNGAIERLEESRVLRQEIGDQDGEASALTNLGIVHLQMPDQAGLVRRAIELFEEARARYLTVGNRRGLAASLMNISEGHLHLALSAAQPDAAPGQPGTPTREHAVQALRYARDSAAEADRQGMQRVSIGARLNAVHAAALLGRIDLGDQMLAQARDRLAQYPAAGLEIGLRLATGHLRRGQGRHQEAITELRAGLAESGTVDASEYRSRLWQELVLALEAAGDPAGALTVFRGYHSEQLAARDRAAERQTQWLKARLDLERVERAEALQRQRADLLAEQNTVLAHEARHDSLTDLPNRRILLERLELELAADRPGFGFALADLDHFKRINDSYSHLVGDQVLRIVADLVRQAMREGDLPARYGGEEFALVVAVTEAGRLRAACNRLRRMVARQPWAELAPGLHLTVSIGATLALPGDTVQTLTARADRQLYTAKRLGRDRVSCTRGDSDPVRAAT